MELNDVFAFLVELVGFVLAAGLTVGVIFWVRRPLAQLLARLIRDETVAQAGTTFVLILLGLRGLSAMFGYITQPNLSQLFGGLTGLLNRLADEIQWAVWIAALLFIGYSIQGWRRAADREESEREA